MESKPMAEIAAVLAAMRRPAEVQDWLRALLTPCERQRIGLRWQLVGLLAAGMPQREIARRLGISLCKITRGSRELRRGPKFFRRLIKQRNAQNLSAAEGGVKPRLRGSLNKNPHKEQG